MAKVVDVSEFQGDINWPKVKKAGYTGAIVRIADGDRKDRRYSRGRTDAIRRAGMTLGVYYYGRVASPGNNERDGRAEARMAIRFAREGGWGKLGKDLPLAYDFEESNKQSAKKAAKHVVQFILEYRKITGHYPIIYTMPAFWASIKPHLTDKGRALIKKCPLWVAHWRVPKPIVPGPWAQAKLWQFSDRGKVDGIGGDVDLNNSLVKLSDLVMRKPKPKPTPKPVPPKPDPNAKKYPKGLPTRYRWHWDHPWRFRARRHPGFRRWLDRHGYLTPHFTLREAKCKCGAAIPDSLNRRARDHAFNLERLRHALGDKPIPIISWYRPRWYNEQIGGASKSKHIEAIATDHPKAWVDAMGRKRVLSVGDAVFRNGGMGIYPWGALHFDTRGVRARWSSF